MIGDCGSAANHATTAGPWEFVGEIDSPKYSLKQECPGGPGDWVGLASVVFGPLVNGFGVDTQNTPLTITHLRLWWRAIGGSSGSSAAEIEVRNGAGYPVPGFAVPNTNSIWDTTAGPQELAFPASDDVSLIRAGERCASSCETWPALLYEGIPVVVQLFGAELTVADDTPPTVTLTGGPEGSTPITGPVPVGFDATDPGAGIEKAELLVDGVPVATDEYSSDCSYTELRPCPESESDQLSVEGSSLPEATHQLAVRVTDAAGNTAVSPPRAVTTARPPVPNGDPCPNPGISLSLDRTSPIPFGEPATLDGRLACGGTPIAAADVQLDSSTIAGARTTSLGALQTAADGTFSYRLPSGPSRKLAFSYTPYSNQTTAATQNTLQVNVEPEITLHIAAIKGHRLIEPPRTHNHGTIVWGGRIEGGPYPAAGIPLLTQVIETKLERVHAHGRWKTVRHEEWDTFHEIVARNGNISYRYTFRRTFRPTIYTFRVATPAGGAAGYEYAAGASNQVSVRVG